MDTTNKAIFECTAFSPFQGKCGVDTGVAPNRNRAYLALAVYCIQVIEIQARGPSDDTSGARVVPKKIQACGNAGRSVLGRTNPSPVPEGLRESILYVPCSISCLMVDGVPVFCILCDDLHPG